jgi:hypothetical protein
MIGNASAGSRRWFALVATALLASCGGGGGGGAAKPSQHSLGGNVSGLVGSLVLHNGSEELAVASSGPFTFANKLDQGTAFAVTVATQPATQACTVANGAGTIGAADVTNVSVTCTTTSFAVGGTVTGLSGTLVLTNQGGPDLTITTNGPYVFPARVQAGAAYSVVVKSHPPAQTCTVSNAAGTANADVTQVNVTCSASHFTVGGTVTGVQVTGLVLGGDLGDCPVAANATSFTCPTAAALGATVNLIVKIQPASPGGTLCTLTGSPVTVGAQNVTSIVVQCTRSTALVRFAAPTSWGALWPDSPSRRMHAYFNGTSIMEDEAIDWGAAVTAPAQRELAAFASTARFGAGPFTNADHYQAAGGDAVLDLASDMLVCAVVKPDYNPIDDGQEKVIVAKGVKGESGWALLQNHHMFTFAYQYSDAGDNNHGEIAYTPTFFADASIVGNGPLNPTLVVVCGGRSGNELHIAANDFPSSQHFPTVTLPATATTLFTGATPHRLTIGGYDTGAPQNQHGGRVYEVAVWDEAATPANIQQKLDSFFNLPSSTRYARNREAPFIGTDGKLHTAWRHAPRLYLPNDAGLNGGLLFGLQGWNRVTQPYTPTGTEIVEQPNSVVALGEELDLWTAAGGAVTTRLDAVPPGDSEQQSAARVSLPPAASLTTPLAGFDVAGPIHAMIWIRPVTASGTLRVTTTPAAASTTSVANVDLSTLTPGQWNRVWLRGLTTDRSAGSVTITNSGDSTVEFHAWGVALTQIAGGGDLGSFDPGPEMYDWAGDAPNDSTNIFPLDVLELAGPGTSTAGTGFCLMVEAQPAPGLAWSGLFAANRSPLSWIANADPNSTVNLFVPGAASADAGKLCGYVQQIDTGVCAPVPAGWTPGSKHTLHLCGDGAGALTLFGDGQQLGGPVTPTTGALPDLSLGKLAIGSNHLTEQSEMATWQGFVTAAAACPFGPVTQCR